MVEQDASHENHNYRIKWTNSSENLTWHLVVFKRDRVDWEINSIYTDRNQNATQRLASISDGSIFVTDSHRGYCKQADAYGVSHIRIPKKHHTSQGFNTQTVNYYHSALKGMINWHFRDVATKYLNNYVVWHNLVNFAKKSEAEKEGIMRDFVFTTRCESFWKKNLTRPVIPCVA